MKISLNLIRYYRDLYQWSGDPAPEGADKLIEKIGAQLGGVEEVISVDKKYDGVVIVQVVSCEDHPNADRLHVCMIDDGGIVPDVPRDENGLVQVVCGAPNVRAGATVAWLPPGATVPSTYDSDPFVLEARELRGVVSNGMLASPKELGIGDSHEGLLIIDEEVEPGTMFADKYSLRGDVVIDIENKMFTHRPDLFGWMGIAREIAGIQSMPFKSPEWYRSDVQIPGSNSEKSLPLEIRNEIPELVPRFTAVTMSDITIGPSPVWLQVELARVGVRPINNIVDLTNYYMLLTGQPLHAYDYDKVVAQDSNDREASDHATIVVRKPHEGEKLTLLNGKEILPRPEAILIASDTKAIGLGGVMGGANTEVDENTKNIILESANFNMYSIRRTSMAHGIFSDAVTRFNKGQSPLQNITVLAKITEDVQRLADGKIASEAIDDNHLPEDVRERNSLHPDVHAGASFINERLGLQLPVDEMARLLTNVEFQVQTEGENLTIRAPFWRTDIEIPEDIVEEVGRLYGFDKLPLELPKRSIVPVRKDPYLETKSKIRDVLSRAGANELLTYSFVHGNLLDKAGQDRSKAYKLSNALSPDLQYYRMSLTPSLLDKVHLNVKAGYDQFALFEIGKAHLRGLEQDGEVSELERVAFVFAANTKAAANYHGAAYYEARKYLINLFEAFGIADFVRIEPLENSDDEWTRTRIPQYEKGRAANIILGNVSIGEIGEYKPAVRKALKLPEYSAGFELNTSILVDPSAYVPEEFVNRVNYVVLSKFPSVTQDITLKVTADTPFGLVYDMVKQNLNKDEAHNLSVQVSPMDIYQSEDDRDHKQITLRLKFTSYEKTLTDSEVTAILDTVAAAAKEQLAADRI